MSIKEVNKEIYLFLKAIKEVNRMDHRVTFEFI